MEGMTREQVVCGGCASLITLISCALLSFVSTPAQVALCGAAALCGLVAFWLSLGEE